MTDESPAPIPDRPTVEKHRATEAEQSLRTQIKYALTQMSPERVRELTKQETYDYSRRS